MIFPPSKLLAVWLLLAVSSVASTAGDSQLSATTPEGPIIAVSSDHRCRLRLTSSEQAPSSWDARVTALTLTFQLEAAARAPDQLSPDLPTNVFIDNDDPLISAVLAHETDVHTNKHFGWTSSLFFGGHARFEATINGLEVGEPQKFLRRLDLAIMMHEVSAWQDVSITIAKPGVPEVFRIAGCTLEVEAGPQRMRFSAGMSLEARDARVLLPEYAPVSFVNGAYLLGHLEMQDARDETFYCVSQDNMSGWEGGVYYITSDRQLNAELGGEKITYPVTINLKLPKTYGTERVTFSFTDLPLKE